MSCEMNNSLEGMLPGLLVGQLVALISSPEIIGTVIETGHQYGPGGGHDQARVEVRKQVAGDPAAPHPYRRETRWVTSSCWYYLTSLALAGCTITPPPAPLPDPPAVGDTVTVRRTIVVAQGQTFDGRGRGYKPVGLGDGSQREGQRPVFLLEPGATLRDFTILPPAADGVHVRAASGRRTTVRDGYWPDVGEDAITVVSGPSSGEVLLDGNRFHQAADKVIQINAAPRTIIRDSTATGFQRFARTNGTPGSPDHAYRVEIRGGTFRDGRTLLKMSNARARGTVSGVRVHNVRHVAEASGGAQIETP
jgi:hypothetical protein